MKTIVKKSILTALCALTLLVGSDSLSGMQDNQSTGILNTIKIGLKSFGQKFVEAYSSHHYNALLGKQSDPKFDGPDAHMALCTEKGKDFSKLTYNRYIKLPLEQKKENKDHKAPEYIQQQSLFYAKIMCRPYNLRDWALFQYLKKFGYLTVYDGAQKNSPQTIFYYASAYTSYRGGIYFPQNSFGKTLSTKQEFSLAHEVGHNINGNMTKLTNDYKEGNATWFRWEYLAEKKALETLYKLKRYEAINYRKKAYIKKKPKGSSLYPYREGFLDTLNLLIKQNPHDKQLQATRSYKEMLCEVVGSVFNRLLGNYQKNPTWESRFKEYKK